MSVNICAKSNAGAPWNPRAYRGGALGGRDWSTMEMWRERALRCFGRCGGANKGPHLGRWGPKPGAPLDLMLAGPETEGGSPKATAGNGPRRPASAPQPERSRDRNGAGGRLPLNAPEPRCNNRSWRNGRSPPPCRWHPLYRQVLAPDRSNTLRRIRSNRPNLHSDMRPP